MRKYLYPLYCGRCGADCTEQRGGQLRPEDYVELWHEHCEFEAEARRTIARQRERIASLEWDLERAHWLISQLEVPTLEQLEIRALRAALEVDRLPGVPHFTGYEAKEEDCPF